LELEHENTEIKDILKNEGDYGLSFFEMISDMILRRYIFVATYQFFENRVTWFCNRIGDKLNLISFKDIHKPNIIDRCRTYLTEVAKINILPESLWQTISNYNKLRNCIVHSEGFVDSDQKGDALRKFAKDHPFLYYEEMDDQIYCEKGFTEEAIRNFGIFLANLEEQLKDYSE
jgi:hypothetical protein